MILSIHWSAFNATSSADGPQNCRSTRLRTPPLGHSSVSFVRWLTNGVGVSRSFSPLAASFVSSLVVDLAKHWDRAHACGGKGANLINPYKKRDRDQARSMMDLTPPSKSQTTTATSDRHSTCSSRSSSSTMKKTSRHNSEDDEQSRTSVVSDNEEAPTRMISEEEKVLSSMSLPNFLPAATTNMFFPPNPFFPHHPMFSSFLNPSLLLQSKFPYPAGMNGNLDLFKQASPFAPRSKSPTSSRSSSPRTSSPLQQQQRMNAVAAMVAAAAANGNATSLRHAQASPQTRKLEKEERNFQCRWCDYRGRWRSELIQHMRCHHARDKPYHCSACPYASSWKWDVQVSSNFPAPFISILFLSLRCRNTWRSNTPTIRRRSWNCRINTSFRPLWKRSTKAPTTEPWLLLLWPMKITVSSVSTCNRSSPRWNTRATARWPVSNARSRPTPWPNSDVIWSFIPRRVRIIVSIVITNRNGSATWRNTCACAIITDRCW